MSFFHRQREKRLSQIDEDEAIPCLRNLSGWTQVVDEIRTWPEYEAQPLRSLEQSARYLGIASLYFKDESKRFGTELGSFKALGAPYAVFKVLQNEVFSQIGVRPTSIELRSGKYRDITQFVTVCVATDGNQGRGLAYGAKIFGCRCVVYIHNHVSEGRARAIKKLGAIIIRISGEYEASVERAREDARMNDWHFVSSTSWDNFDEQIPQNVMKAYMTLVEEAKAVLSGRPVTHVFVCGGVGSIAAAIFLGLWTRHQQLEQINVHNSVEPPRFVVVEPIEADCLFQSAMKCQSSSSEGSLHTIMAGLACRSPSPAALKILYWLASDFVRVSDSFAVDGMKALAAGWNGDVPVVCGESSAASVGLLMKANGDRSIRDQLGIDGQSHVLVFGLEGATDAAIYHDLVGVHPRDVFQAQYRYLYSEKLNAKVNDA